MYLKLIKYYLKILNKLFFKKYNNIYLNITINSIKSVNKIF